MKPHEWEQLLFFVVVKFIAQIALK